MRHATVLVSILVLATGSAGANTYGSVEPIPAPAVIDTTPLLDTSLAVRKAFAERVMQCGIVDGVLEVLSQTGATTTINDLNTSFELTAGGFMGVTAPTYGYVIVDSGPNGASAADIEVLTDSLAYVMSQSAAFLLDADDPSSYAFPANYVVLNFDAQPSMEDSAALFEAVGNVDPELFETDSAGYTQYGYAYLSLQPFVDDQQFIDGHLMAAEAFGVAYTPFVSVSGLPGLFAGGAAFPFNDWIESPNGEDYLMRLPIASHGHLSSLRERHLRVTRRALRRLELFPHAHDRVLVHLMHSLPCD